MSIKSGQSHIGFFWIFFCGVFLILLLCIFYDDKANFPIRSPNEFLAKFWVNFFGGCDYHCAFTVEVSNIHRVTKLVVCQTTLLVNDWAHFIYKQNINICLLIFVCDKNFFHSVLVSFYVLQCLNVTILKSRRRFSGKDRVIIMHVSDTGETIEKEDDAN